MAITVRQSNIQANSGGGTATCVWAGVTTPGSLLVMGIACMGGSGATLTTPSGWTKIGEKDNGTSCKVAMYIIAGAAQRNGTETLTLDTSRFAIMALAEYPKVTLSSPQDASAINNTGSSTSPSTGNFATTNANDVLVAVIAAWNATFATPPTQATPTNSFTLERTVNNNDATAGDLSLGLLERIVSATYSSSAGDTLANSSAWSALAQAFKEATALGAVGVSGVVGNCGRTKAASVPNFAMVFQRQRVVVLGNGGSSDRYFNGLKQTSDGSPAQPSLEMSDAGIFRFRWAVTTGTRTLSVKVANLDGASPYPTMRIKANPAIGVNSDVVGTAIAGTGWQTIGPISVSPSGNGVLLVELEQHQFSNLQRNCRWDHLVDSTGRSDDFAEWLNGAPFIDINEVQTGPTPATRGFGGVG